MMILYLDTETFSPVPLKHGVHRYAEQAKILLTAWALGDGEVSVEEGWPSFLNGFVEQVDRIVIHNSHFDRTVLRHAEGIELPLKKIWDTMAQARSVGLPGGLERLCEVLKIDEADAKDKAGKALIQLFCKPLPRGKGRATAATHPVEWERFRTYAGADIRAMRQVYKILPKWNYEDATERALWEADQAVNDRGFLVDLDLARGAIRAVNERKGELADRCIEITDGAVQSATQRDALLAHLLEAHGVSLPDLQKGTLERRLNDETLPDVVRELIAIRLEASGTAVAKYQRLVEGVSADGRLRGTLEWCGAARTGRWAGRLFQPQNLPRSPGWFKKAEQEISVAALKSPIPELVVDNVVARATYAIRGSIIAPPGKKLIIADLSNIEGRTLAWLAGEEWKLEAFRQFDAGIGHDLYKITAAGIVGKDPEQVNDDERQSAGKVPELACGYQGAVGAFSSMAALYGLVLPEDQVLSIVKAWRRKNSAIVKFWYQLQDAAFTAVRSPGVVIPCGVLRLRRDGAWLRVRLPSGRSLCYTSPKITAGRKCGWCEGTGKEPQFDVEDTTWESRRLPPQPTDPRCTDCFGKGYLPEVLSYIGLDPYTRRWADIQTYGGKLVENVTQAVARDVMADAVLRIERGNMPADVVLTVHDEIICEAPDDGFTADDLAGAMSLNPSWAPGLPLAAKGFETKRYRKD